MVGICVIGDIAPLQAYAVGEAVDVSHQRVTVDGTFGDCDAVLVGVHILNAEVDVVLYQAVLVLDFEHYDILVLFGHYDAVCDCGPIDGAFLCLCIGIDDDEVAKLHKSECGSGFNVSYDKIGKERCLRHTVAESVVIVGIEVGRLLDKGFHLHCRVLLIAHSLHSASAEASRQRRREGGAGSEGCGGVVVGVGDLGIAEVADVGFQASVGSRAVAAEADVLVGGQRGLDAANREDAVGIGRGTDDFPVLVLARVAGAVAYKYAFTCSKVGGL